MNPFSRNMYRNSRNSGPRNQGNLNQDDRFFGGGIIAPLLIGGIAGYAIGNNQNDYPYGGGFGGPIVGPIYPQPYYPTYYNSYYYNTYPYY